MKNSYTFKNRQYFIVLLFFLLTLVMTYPTFICFFSRPIASYGDKYQFIWNIWWVNKCIMEFKDIYTIDYLFYPFSFCGIFHAFGLFPILITIPFYHLFGVVFTYNLIAFLSFFLGGLFMYRLVLYLTKDSSSAFIAGLIFAFSPIRVRLVSNSGYFNMYFDAFVPLFVLFFYKMLETRKYKYAVFSSLCFASIFYTEYQLAIYTVILGMILSGYFFISHIKEPIILFSYLKHIIIFSVIVFIFTVPVLVQIDMSEYSEVASSGLEEITGSYLINYTSSVFYRGNLYRYIGKIAPGFARYFLPIFGWGGVFLLILSVIRLRSVRGGWIWLFSFFIFFLLSFGPYFTISPFVNFRCPAPFLIFTKLPVLDAIRASWRIISFAFFAFAVFVGLYYRYILNYLSSKFSNLNKDRIYAILHISLCFILLAEYINIPFHTSIEYDYISSHYQTVRDDTEDCSVIEMPLSWTWAKANAGVWAIQYMLYPAFHNKRMVNGYVCKLSPYVFNYFTNLPLFKIFLLMQEGKIPDYKLIDEAQSVADGFLSIADLKYIVVFRKELEKLKYKHKGYDFIPDYLDLVRRVFPVLEERTDDQGNIMFILEKAKDIKRNTYRMSDKDIRAYIARGVFPEVEGGELRWITGNSAIFAFPNQGHKYSRVRIFGFPQYAEGKKQTIKVSINGRTAYEGTVEKEPSYIDIEMEDEDFRDKNIFLDLEFAYSISARELGTGNDTRTLSYMISEIIFEE